MITKEVENILKSFPSFLQMTSQAANPVLSTHQHVDRLEIVTKAVWFVVPFHFLSFLGLVPIQGSDPLIVLLIGFLTLLGLSWIGTVIGFVASALQGVNHENSGGIISAWVVALVTTWFFCVVIISGTNLWLWFTKLSSNTIIWPDLVAELRYLFAGTGFQGLEVLLLCFAVPLLAVVPLILSYSRETRGNFWQIGVVSIVCTVTCAVFIAATIFFLRPVTQGCNPLTQANCL